MLTVTLRNGITVLARQTKYGVTAYTFANQTQAQNRVDKLRAQGVNCGVFKSVHYRPFFVMVDPPTD